jgi:hypothetical protein
MSMNPEGEAAMLGLIDLCRQRGIRLILVYSPEYYEMQELTINRSEIFSEFEKMSRKYQVPFWDYSRCPLVYERKYFNNSQHMNVDGASAFSENLAERIAGFVRSEGNYVVKDGLSIAW